MLPFPEAYHRLAIMRKGEKIRLNRPPEGEERRGKGGRQTSSSRHRPHTSWSTESQSQPTYMCLDPSGNTGHTGGTHKVIRSDFFCAGTFNIAEKIGQTNGQTDGDTDGRTHTHTRSHVTNEDQGQLQKVPFQMDQQQHLSTWLR